MVSQSLIGILFCYCCFSLDLEDFQYMVLWPKCLRPFKTDVEMLTLMEMVLEGGAFARCLVHEGRAFIGNSAITKEAAERSLLSSTLLGHSRKTAFYE